MENELDLTLKLGLPISTVDTHMSLSTPTYDQDTNLVDGGDNNDETVRNNIRRAIWGDESASNNMNVDVNIRVYNYVFQRFAGAPNTFNFAPYPMPPAPVTPPTSDYVLLDVPAKRAHRNNSLAMTNASARWPGGFGGNSGSRNEGTRKCTNMNCNALTTPLWRRGPLGPKSLCNACGIKFRKEELRKSRDPKETE